MHPRYEILATIAQGEFATVFHARDHELGREVAIKQIHPQYLADPAKLERYWQEAHLLASLEHPYVLTIYDIVRDRGWLILELMQGNIQQRLAGQPIDLDFLRVTLICALHALRVLAENGIVHGDVKPGNLLLDKANRVKLGDFGIARRLEGDDGSLVKGATKYMAPEVVSDQYGPIGPHSDLYSLGFTAYELMCGANFENLFPGLDMFGGNRQMAWIMWHAALDRRLPEINRVLAGVPDDLVAVIQKLTEKDPARRYRTAEEAIADLRTKAKLPGAELAVGADEPPPVNRVKRYAAVAALALSVAMSLAMVVIPRESPEPPPAVEAPAHDGTVHQIDVERGHFFLMPKEGGTPQRVTVDPQVDRLLLNGQSARLQDLQPGDQVEIARNRREDGQLWQEIVVSRNVSQDSGVVVEVDGTHGAITIARDDGEKLRVEVPASAKIQLNGVRTVGSRPLQVADLQPDDVVVLIEHVPSESGRLATALQVKRIVALTGALVGFDANAGTVSVRVGQGESGAVQTFPVADECIVTVNGAASVDGRRLTLADLQIGDRVTAHRDTHYVAIDAVRQFELAGTVASLDLAAGRLGVVPMGQVEPVEFTLAPTCSVRIVGRTTPATLASLRVGDTVKIKHDSYTLKQPQALEVVAAAVPDKRTWAVVIGQQQYDDMRLALLKNTKQDAEQVRDALTAEYRVPQDQLLFELDATALHVKNRLAEFLPKVAPGSQLLVYFAGHGYIDKTAGPMLATKEFNADRMEPTGISLRWLIDQLEACPAGEKILLIDTGRGEGGEGSTAAAVQPSSDQLVASLKHGAAGIARSVTIVASSSGSQHGLELPEKDQGLFASEVAMALRGAADANGDHVAQASELFAYLEAAMAALHGPGGAQQKPTLYRPDATPVRLSEKAQAAVRRILSFGTSGQNIDPETLRLQAREAEKLAPGEPDFELALALVFLRQGKTSFANQHFTQVLRGHPEATLAHHGVAWLYFLDKDYGPGVHHLIKVLDTLGAPAGDAEPGRYAKHVYQWAGGLRGFLSKTVNPNDQPATIKQLDELVLKHGPIAKELYLADYTEVRRKYDRLQERLDAATTDSERTRLQFEQKRLTYYMSFNFDEAENYLGMQIQK